MLLSRGRIFRVLRQVVGNLEPRRFAADEAVQLRPHRRIVEQGQRDAVLWRAVGKRCGRCPVRPGAVDDRRAALAAEAALVAARAFVEFREVLTLEPAEIGHREADPAAKRRAMLLAALRAMTVQRRR